MQLIFVDILSLVPFLSFIPLVLIRVCLVYQVQNVYINHLLTFDQIYDVVVPPLCQRFGFLPFSVSYRTVEYLYEKRELDKAKKILSAILLKTPYCLDLWKVYCHLSLFSLISSYLRFRKCDDGVYRFPRVFNMNFLLVLTSRKIHPNIGL